MWEAINYVSSGFTLVAFIVAVGAWVYTSKIRERERLLKTAPENERTLLVQNASEYVALKYQKWLKKNGVTQSMNRKK